jgi:hypothetical protein
MSSQRLLGGNVPETSKSRSGRALLPHKVGKRGADLTFATSLTEGTGESIGLVTGYPRDCHLTFKSMFNDECSPD